MKTFKIPFILQLLLLAMAGAAAAMAQFTSGSDGSYGPIDIQSNTTLDVPPDGIFHATTVNIASSRVLTFNRNAHNTPVYLLATGDVILEGDINVNGGPGNNVVGGLAGPGGFDGGNPASVSTPPGDGYGPGAGKAGVPGNVADSAGAGGYAAVSTAATVNKGPAYGSALLIPLVGGSGGGGTTGNPGQGGGAGGGAILIASNTRIHMASTSADILATGGTSSSGNVNGGSGGAIRLVAPVITGSGSLRVNGSFSGGPGRIRIDTLDRSGMNLNFTPSGITSIGSLMVVFPTPIPRLDIIEVAGTAIPEGSNPVVFTLPFGSSPDRTIRVQARDFNDIVPIEVVLTPDNGPSVRYEAEIDNQTANPAEGTVNITLPVNVQTRINVWTR